MNSNGTKLPQISWECYLKLLSDISTKKMRTFNEQTDPSLNVLQLQSLFVHGTIYPELTLANWNNNVAEQSEIASTAGEIRHKGVGYLLTSYSC